MGCVGQMGRLTGQEYIQVVNIGATSNRIHPLRLCCCFALRLESCGQIDVALKCGVPASGSSASWLGLKVEKTEMSVGSSLRSVPPILSMDFLCWDECLPTTVMLLSGGCPVPPASSDSGRILSGSLWVAGRHIVSFLSYILHCAVRSVRRVPLN